MEYKITIHDESETIESAENFESEKYSTKTSCYLVFKIKSKKLEYLIKYCLSKKYFAKLPSYIKS